MVGLSLRLVRWVKERPWLLALVLVGVIAVPGFVRVEQISSQQRQTIQQQQHTIGCITEIADQLVMRSNAIAVPNQLRADALDDLIRASVSRDQTQIQEKLALYIRRSDELKLKLRDNPIPERPKFTCPE